MQFRIRTLQVPKKGAGAFLPTFTYGGAPATNGVNIVIGAPGTVPVYSPRPAALSDGESGGPYNQPSSVAPNYILPSLYTFIPSAFNKFRGALVGTNDHALPTPIANPTRTASQWQHRVRVGGRTATPNVRPFMRWPVYGGGPSS